MGIFNNIVEKLGFAGGRRVDTRDRYTESEGSTAPTIAITKAFEKIETVGRGVSMLVDAASSLDYDVKDSLPASIATGVRKKTLENLLNFRPNNYQSVQDFRQNIFTDLILEGNVFIYYDGAFMHHLPAKDVEIIKDPKAFISGYVLSGTTHFTPEEVFHFKDTSSDSIYRGESRLKPAQKNIDNLYNMYEFQQNFFNNGASFGLVLCTENTLSQVAKEKTILHWLQKYSIKNGAKRPVILDSGLKPHNMAETSFKDMDFDVGIKTHSEKILQALGIPPILLAGGNNANISPNLRLFYLETVLPMTRKYVSALERFFGYDVETVTSNVSALQPELKDIAGYYTTLVNGGVISPNEAREELRYDKKPGHDDLRVPANIAGSAANPSVGGKPKQPAAKE